MGRANPRTSEESCALRFMDQSLDSAAFTFFLVSQGSCFPVSYMASVFLTFKDLGESLAAPVQMAEQGSHTGVCLPSPHVVGQGAGHYPTRPHQRPHR